MRTSPAFRREIRGLVLASLGVLVLLAPLSARAGDDGPAPGEGSPPWDGETYRPYRDDASGIHFEVPMLGFRVEARHLDPKSPPSQIKAYFAVSGPEGTEVGIDVFEDSEKLGLPGFFDRHLGFMADAAAAVSRGTAGPARGPAIEVEQPPGPGSLPQVSTIFAVGPRIFRVTCVDTGNERAVKVYRRILDTLAGAAK